jgi:hypothetical protein
MIGLLSASSLLVGAQIPIKVDAKYMIQALYPAGSLKKDTISPGGNAESSNMPQPIRGRKLVMKALFANLSQTDDGVKIEFWNSTDQDEWMRAADGNMLAWLEALDGNEWKPIEYHNWSDCGNSFHRVVLPAGYEWTYNKILPRGDWRTFVRWVAVREKLKVTSNMMLMNIPRTRTSIPMGLGGRFELKNNGYPILMPRK